MSNQEKLSIQLKSLDGIIKKYRNAPGELLSILEEIQNASDHKYLSPEVLFHLANKLNLPLAQIYSVVTFYTFFNLKPQGEHSIIVCRGTACHTRRSRNILEYIKKLLDLGYIRKTGKTLSPTSKFFSLLILGTVPAGFPIIADEDRKYLTLDEYLIDDPVTSFLFTVRGDSLVGEGIMDGDLVVVEKNQSAMLGDIVLAEIDHEWTLKILRRNQQSRTYYLEAANPNYPPFYAMQEMKIFGVVKAVIRRLRN